MTKFNLGNFLNDEVFNKTEFKQFTRTIGSVTGQFIDYAKNMANNMLKLSTMGSSYFPIIIFSGVSLVVLWKLKII